MPDARIDRLEDAMGRAFNAIEALADKQARLDDVITTLTEAQIKLDLASRERDRALDARVDKLVTAIGEFIRRMPAQ